MLEETCALAPRPLQHPVIFLQEAAQTLMKRGSISVRTVSDSASLATAPLGLLKWLKFNVQNESWVWRVGRGGGMHF